MIIVFATAVVSATRVSRMNIAEGGARGAREHCSGRRAVPGRAGKAAAHIPWASPGLSVAGPLFHSSGRFLRGTLRSLASVLWVIVFPIWIVDFAVSVVRFSLPYLRRGWLVFLIGTVLYLGGAYSWKSAAGPSPWVRPLMILGFGLMMRLLVAARPQFTEVFGLLLALSGVLLVPSTAS